MMRLECCQIKHHIISFNLLMQLQRGSLQQDDLSGKQILLFFFSFRQKLYIICIQNTDQFDL